MKSVDKVFSSLAKKQKYLLLRIFTIFLLVIIGLEGIYTTENIGERVFFNTLLLFFGPLFVEYFLGMDTYSTYTNRMRWAGFLFTGFAIFLCVMGIMGKGTIVLDPETKLFSHSVIFGFIVIESLFIKIYTAIIVGFAIGDFVFTLNKQELYYYSTYQKFEGLLESHIKELKEKDQVETRKNIFKSKILKNIEVSGGK